MMLMMGREGERVGRAQSERLLPPPPSYSRSSLLSCSVLGAWLGQGCRDAAQSVVLWAETRGEMKAGRTSLPCHRTATSSSQPASPPPRRRSRDYFAHNKAHRRVAEARQGIGLARRPFSFSAHASSSERRAGRFSIAHFVCLRLTHNRQRRRRCASVDV